MDRTDELRAFLRTELRIAGSDDIEAVLNALAYEERQFDRYQQTQESWIGYGKRRRALKAIRTKSSFLLKELGRLDPITQDEFQNFLGEEGLAIIKGNIADLMTKSDMLVESIQKTGRPRIIHEERWIQAIADIYEHNTKKKIRFLDGKESQNRTNRGPFYKLLQLARPGSFNRREALHPREVKRVLSRRNKSYRRVLVLVSESKKNEDD